MVIEYCPSKEVRCYRDFVLNPDDRRTQRAFSKTFGHHLMEPAKKLHDRLRQYASAGAYNAVYGQSDNCIEIKQGGARKDPLTLKVRVDRSYRKFFNSVADDEGNLLPVKDWQGDFKAVTTLYVVAVNHHDYNV